MSDAIEINRGEGVRAEVRWTNEDGTPIDITGRELSISDAYPAALLSGTLTATEAQDGRAELVIPAALAPTLGGGRTNWVRLAMSLPGGERDTTPPIWIAVV